MSELFSLNYPNFEFNINDTLGTSVDIKPNLLTLTDGTYTTSIAPSVVSTTNVSIAGILADSTGYKGDANQVLSSTGNNVLWVNPSTLPISDASGMNGNFLFSDNSGTVYYKNIEGNPYMYTDGDSIKVTSNNGFFDLTGGALINTNSIANYTTQGATFLDIFNGDGAPSDPTIWSEEILMSGQNQIWMNTNNGHNSLLYDVDGKLSSATYAGAVDYQVPLTVPENWSIDALGKATLFRINMYSSDGGAHNHMQPDYNVIESYNNNSAQIYNYSTSASAYGISGSVQYDVGLDADANGKYGQVYMDTVDPITNIQTSQYFGFNGNETPAMGATSYNPATTITTVVPIVSNSPLSLVGSDASAVQISCSGSALSIDTPLNTTTKTATSNFLPVVVGGTTYYIQLFQ
jgi:hypothetical protein